MFDKFWQSYGPWHLEFLHILARLLNSSYILEWIWMKLGRDVAPQVYRSAGGEIIHVRLEVQFWQSYGPWHLEFLHILARLLNSSYILEWIWMKLGRDVAPQV